MSIPSDETVRRIVAAMTADAGAAGCPITTSDLQRAAGVSDAEFDAFFQVFLNRGLFTAMGPPRAGGTVRPHRRLANELRRFGGRDEHYTLNTMLGVAMGLASHDRLRRMLPIFAALRRARTEEPRIELPSITLGQFLVFGDDTAEGQIIDALSVPWPELLGKVRSVPLDRLHQIEWRELEEIVAASYVANGYDRVVLTPRSGDFGKDVIAYKKGGLELRIFDQVKAYRPGRPVNLVEVKSVLADAQTVHFNRV